MFGEYVDRVHPTELDRGLLLTRKPLNEGFLLAKSSLRKFYGCHHDLVDRWNICVTNDNGYVPLVVNTFRSFPHSWLITGFVTRITRRVSLVVQDLITLPEHPSSPPVFSGVRVTRSLVYFIPWYPTRYWEECLKKKTDDKRNDCNFPIVHFLFISSKFSATSRNWVYVS